MKPEKFRKKPVVIEAMHFDGVSLKTMLAIEEWAGKEKVIFALAQESVETKERKPEYAIIPTLEGPMRAEVGDWIIKGIKGEFYPCKPDIFAATYEAEPQHGLVKQKTNGELVLDPEAPTPEGEYLACGCADPPEQEGDAPIECGKEAVAVWDIAYMGTIIASSMHACARHDQGIRQMAKVPPIGMRRALKRVELADAIPDAHSGGVVMKKC